MNESPCHYQRPFIDRNGVLFPCCFLSRKPEAAIGHISDVDIASKVENFSIECQCDHAKFRKKTSDDSMKVLYIQASLKCHGKCAVCYVKAPHKKENIEVNYEDAYRVVKVLNPACVCLEGGEIPIIPKAMLFAEKLKSDFDQTKLRLITNGNYGKAKSQKIAEFLMK